MLALLHISRSNCILPGRVVLEFYDDNSEHRVSSRGKTSTKLDIESDVASRSLTTFRYVHAWWRRWKRIYRTDSLKRMKLYGISRVGNSRGLLCCKMQSKQLWHHVQAQDIFVSFCNASTCYFFVEALRHVFATANILAVGCSPIFYLFNNKQYNQSRNSPGVWGGWRKSESRKENDDSAWAACLCVFERATWIILNDFPKHAVREHLSSGFFDCLMVVSLHEHTFICFVPLRERHCANFGCFSMALTALWQCHARIGIRGDMRKGSRAARFRESRAKQFVPFDISKGAQKKFGVFLPFDRWMSSDVTWNKKGETLEGMHFSHPFPSMSEHISKKRSEKNRGKVVFIMLAHVIRLSRFVCVTYSCSLLFLFRWFLLFTRFAILLMCSRVALCITSMHFRYRFDDCNVFWWWQRKILGK